MSSRLALGTAQFGQAYGIANRGEPVGFEEIGRMLDTAWNAGIDTLDTAIAYGTSEDRLGAAGVRQWRVITKLPSIPDEVDVDKWVDTALAGSLKRLGLEQLHAVLLHRPADLEGPRGPDLYDALRRAQQRGQTQKIGLSVYRPGELEALASRFPMDIVQAPFNVFDRRMDDSGWLDRLHRQGVELHVRSVFLQGLLLMPRGSQPEAFARWRPLFDRWHDWLERSHVAPLDACLQFVRACPQIDRIVVGVDSHVHLEEVIAASMKAVSAPPAALATEDTALIEPSNWSIP